MLFREERFEEVGMRLSYIPHHLVPIELTQSTTFPVLPSFKVAARMSLRCVLLRSQHSSPACQPQIADWSSVHLSHEPLEINLVTLGACILCKRFFFSVSRSV